MLISVVAVAFLLAGVNSSEPQLVVKTTLGDLKGFSGESRNGRAYSGFLGIQYGVVRTRFQASRLITAEIDWTSWKGLVLVVNLNLRPQPAEPVSGWDGIRNALEFGSDCPQKNIRTGESSLDENCLFLNVFVPGVNSNSKSGKRWIFVIPIIFIPGSGKEDASLVLHSWRGLGSWIE